jgi:hypothetical protein
MDSLANFIAFSELTGLNNPLFGNESNRDTFYFDAYHNIGNQAIHCLETNVNDLSENLNIVCADDPLPEVSFIPSDIRVAPDGFVYLAGERDSVGSRYGWVAKWTSDGNLIWSKSYRCSESIPDGVSFFYGLDFLPNGNMVITGQAREPVSQSSPRYNWLLILDENGCFNGDCADFITIDSDIVGVENLESPTPTETLCRIWPNPVRSHFTLSIAEEGDIAIYNAQGMTILGPSRVEAGIMNCTANDWAVGMYLVCFSQKNCTTSVMVPMIVLPK